MTWKKTPECAEWHVFKEVDDYNKKHHPIRFFFLDTIPDRFSSLCYIISRQWWALKHRIVPKHRYHIVNTRLKPGYYDIPELMLYVNFSLLLRYVEDEKCFDNIHWDSDDVHRCVVSELEDLYHWWKYEYPKRE